MSNGIQENCEGHITLSKIKMILDLNIKQHKYNWKLRNEHGNYFTYDSTFIFFVSKTPFSRHTI